MADQREIPELLDSEDMDRFMTDPDFRETRRQEKYLPPTPPQADRPLRGYRRDWLFEDDELVPSVPAFSDEVAELMTHKLARMKPLVDVITASYDLGIPHATALKRYTHRPAERYLGVTALEEHSPEERQAIQQAAERMPVNIGDITRHNLWLKMRIADVRAAYIMQFLRGSYTEEAVDDPRVMVADAVADLGYCLRKDKEARGLVKSVNRAIIPELPIPQHIEHVGLYAADHPETLSDNVGLVRLTLQQQEIRSNYWGLRYNVAEAELGQAPTRLQEQDRGIRELLEELYSSSESTAA